MFTRNVSRPQHFNYLYLYLKLIFHENNPQHWKIFQSISCEFKQKGVFFLSTKFFIAAFSEKSLPHLCPAQLRTFLKMIQTRVFLGRGTTFDKGHFFPRPPHIWKQKPYILKNTHGPYFGQDVFTLSPPPHVPGYNSSVGSHTLPGDNKIWLFMIQTILSTFTGKWKFLRYCSNYYIIHILYCSDENIFTKCYMLIFKQNYLSISQPNHFSGIFKWFTIAIKLLNQI